jgi:hypothetical protein
MDKQLQNMITETFTIALTQAFQDGGKKLKSKFSNGNYQVQDLIDEIINSMGLSGFESGFAPRSKDPRGITPGGETAEEFENITRNVQHFVMKEMSKSSTDSPEYAFVASLGVVSEITVLQYYKDKKIDCNDPETQNVTEVMNPQKACATVPFLKPACDYLAILQAEVGDIPICAGETKESIVESYNL